MVSDVKSKPRKVIDLFSGCGGFSYGYQQAGFEVVLGVDNTDVALETFKHNHINSETLNLDLHLEESIDVIVEAVSNVDIDIIIAGPPCQGFSLTGTRNINDERNSLFNAVFRLAKKISPEAIVIENVIGILNLYGGKAKDEIVRLCDDLGYSCEYKIMYAPDYGVPQIRKRAFFVALKKDRYSNFVFPDKTHEYNYVTSGDAISDLPSLELNIGLEEASYLKDAQTDYQRMMRDGHSVLFNHVGTLHKDHVIDVIKQVPEGGNYKDLPEGVGVSRKFNEAWTRYHRNKPSRTIDTGHRNHFHYTYNRVPTVRENARLQSFPDCFQFKGCKTAQYRQVGNAVPPLLGKVLGQKILGYLSNYD